MSLRRAGAVLFSVLALASCTEPGTTPGSVRIDIRAALASQPTTPVAIDRVRAEVIRPPGDVIASDERTIPPGQDYVEMDLRVTLNAEQEQLVVRVSMWSGDLLRYRGDATMLVDASQSVNESPIIELLAIAPVLDVPTDGLVLGGRPGEGPVTQTFTITNGGGELLNWSAAADRDWLEVSPASGTLRADEIATVVAAVDVSMLEPGVHNGTITVSAPGAAGAPVVVPVQVQVEAAAQFTVFPGSLAFTTNVGANPAGQTLTLMNGTFASVNWTITEDGPWLAVSPASGTLASGASGTVTAAVTAAGLPAGSYNATITVVPQGGTPLSVPVSLTVTAPRPTIRLTPTQLAFTAQVGTNPEAATLEIGNAGAGALAWVATDNAPWLTLGTTAGAVPAGASQAVPVTVSTTGLAVGTYDAVITVTDPKATNSPQTANVQLTITAAPTFALTVQGGGTGQGTVTRQNGAIDCSINAGVTSGTCTESLTAGTAVTLAAVPQANSAFAGWSGACTGTGECQVTMDQARTVTATFNLTPARLDVTPDTLEFVSQVDSAALPQPLTIANTGGQTLNWTATANAPWVNVPASGSVASGENVVVPVVANTAGLGVGDYSAVITVSAPGAADSPHAVVVRLTITAAPTYTLTVQGAGTGQGTVVRQGGLLNCSINAGVATGTCAQSYSQGTVVTLAVIPVANSTFTGWSGACTGTGACAITMDQARTVTAGFALIPAGLSVTPDTLTFVTQEGQSPASQQMTIANTGGATLNWTATPDAPWVSVPGSGTVPYAGIVGLDVGVNATGLAVGTHEAKVMVAAPGATGAPDSVIVRLTVTAIPTYTLTVQGAGTGSGSILDNTGGINCQYNGATTSGDCTESYPDGTLVTLQTSSPLPGGAPTQTPVWAGACTGTGPCEVAMTVNRSATATFTLVPAGIGLLSTSLSLTAQEGANIAQDLLQLVNTGGATLNWSASSNAPWLSVAPTSGNLAFDIAQGINVFANASGLAPGVYQGTLTFTAAGASNSPQNVAVQFTVTATPTYALTVQGSGTGQGTVVQQSGPINCSINAGGVSGTCVQSYDEGTVVTLDVIPEANSTFSGWSGACTGTGPCQVTMDQARTVSAGFALIPAGLSVNPDLLTFTTQQGIDPAIQQMQIANTGGTTLNWTAGTNAAWVTVPASGSVPYGGLVGIDVDVNVAGLTPGDYQAVITVTAAGATNSPQTVDVQLTVTATPTYALTVQGSGTGQGTVVQQSGPINCSINAGGVSGTCVQSYNQGTVVTLDVIPEANSTFSGWSGACTGTGPCQVTMDQARTVTAGFALIPPGLSVNPDLLTFGAQEGSDPAVQQMTIANTGGATLNWTASTNAAWVTVPASGSVPYGGLVGVDVDVNVAGLAVGDYQAVITVTALGATNSPQTVDVQLTVSEIPAYTLTVQGAGTGLGAVTANVGSIDCDILDGVASGACSDTYLEGTEVQLQVIETGDTDFLGWSGACTGSSLTCTVTMNANAVVTATFVDTTPVQIFLSEDVLNFPLEQEAQQNLLVDLTRTGQGDLAWSLSSSAAWLTADPTSGTLATDGSEILTVTVNTTGLAVGDYSGTLTVTAAGAVNSPQVMTINLTVEPLVLALNVQGAGNGSGTVTDDLGSINCSISFGSGSGTCGAGYDLGTIVTLTAQPDANSIFDGWSGACNGTGTCQVTMDQAQSAIATFSQTIEFGVAPLNLSFTAEEGTDPETQYLDLYNNSSTQSLDYTVSVDSAWILYGGPTSGTLTELQVISPGVSIDTNGLPVGTYQGTVTFSAPDAVNSPQIVTVTLEVTPAVSPTLSNPVSQLVEVNDPVGCFDYSPAVSLFTYTFDYTDPDGDVYDGDAYLNVDYTYPGGGSGTFGGTATVTGDGYSGTVSMNVCVPFNGNPSVTFYYTLYDYESNVSNVVEIVTTAPEGANGTVPDAQSAQRPGVKPGTAIERRIIRQ